MAKLYLCLLILLSNSLFAQNFFSFSSSMKFSSAEKKALEEFEKLQPQVTPVYAEQFEKAVREVNAQKAKRKNECLKYEGAKSKECNNLLKEFEVKYLEIEWDKKREYLKLSSEESLRRLNDYYSQALKAVN